MRVCASGCEQLYNVRTKTDARYSRQEIVQIHDTLHFHASLNFPFLYSHSCRTCLPVNLLAEILDFLISARIHGEKFLAARFQLLFDCIHRLAMVTKFLQERVVFFRRGLEILMQVL